MNSLNTTRKVERTAVHRAPSGCAMCQAGLWPCPFRHCPWSEWSGPDRLERLARLARPETKRKTKIHVKWCKMNMKFRSLKENVFEKLINKQSRPKLFLFPECNQLWNLCQRLHWSFSISSLARITANAKLNKQYGQNRCRARSMSNH